MHVNDVIEAIKALTEVVKANNTFFGNEEVMNEANDKIKILIKELNKY
jgi:hypothetical protein